MDYSALTFLVQDKRMNGLGQGNFETKKLNKKKFRQIHEKGEICSSLLCNPASFPLNTVVGNNQSIDIQQTPPEQHHAAILKEGGRKDMVTLSIYKLCR